MTVPFDPTGLAYLQAGQQPSASQLRFLTMLKMVTEDFKHEDQYVVVTPKVGPAAVKILTCQHAAQMIYDKEGRLATEEEIEAEKVKQELAFNEAQKQMDKQDLAKSVQRLMRN